MTGTTHTSCSKWKVSHTHPSKVLRVAEQRASIRQDESVATDPGGAGYEPAMRITERMESTLPLPDANLLESLTKSGMHRDEALIHRVALRTTKQPQMGPKHKRTSLVEGKERARAEAPQKPQGRGKGATKRKTGEEEDKRGNRQKDTRKSEKK
jgi:hypothetical protein